MNNISPRLRRIVNTGGFSGVGGKKIIALNSGSQPPPTPTPTPTIYTYDPDVLISFNAVTPDETLPVSLFNVFENI